MAGGLRRMSRYLGAKGHGDRVDTVFYPPARVQRISVSGGAPQTSLVKRFMETDANFDVQPEHKLVLRPVVGLTENLPKADLELITIEAMKTHRHLRDQAEAKFEQWQSSEPVAQEGRIGPARIAYILATINLHAQQTVLSTLLDVLGYVPKGSGRKDR